MLRALDILRRNSQEQSWSYHPSGPVAAEPAAWTCLALATHGDYEAAKLAGDWLARIQTKSGSVGVTATQETPAWPTSLAILAWHYLDTVTGQADYATQIERAVRWALEDKGKPLSPQPEIGHDSMLIGWSWAADTHSWLEPTSMFAMALKVAGHSDHKRTREAIRLIVDRQLPEGGCNYGNTIVLGQTLLSHVQPTGLAMLALAGENASDKRIAKSLDFLQSALDEQTSAASLAYAVLGLRAHGRSATQADELLQSASEKTEKLLQVGTARLSSGTESGLARPNCSANGGGPVVSCPKQEQNGWRAQPSHGARRRWRDHR